MMWGDGMMWGMGWALVFWALLAIGLIIVAVVLVIVFTRNSTGHDRRTDPRGHSETVGSWRAREILEERYARGEISADDLRERLRVLEQGER
ncbi:SHOCT domain-containing protein [Leucobacter sp. W1153]|uniref:SHOCT domain-containing protein n=1 Tax=unclassified Leucobacter TaxID=2621730 RepID=UPI003F2EAC79